MKREERYSFLLEYYKKTMPKVTTELEFGSVFQLLVATLLSAQCTDRRVNIVTPALFERYPDALAMSRAGADDIFEFISSVSYPNAKSRHLVAMAKALVADFHGEVPGSMEYLVKLPGVGRKTANVIQAVAFGRSAIAVDTHVYRVSHRLGLVSKTADTPYKVEMQLKKNIPSDMAADAHHWILLHGRYICTSRKPHCEKCPFDSFCPKIMEFKKL